MEVCSINIIFNLFIIISLMLNKNNFIESYSQVSRVGAISNNNNNNNTNSAIIKHNPGREGVSSSDNVENNKTMSEYNDDEIATIENKSTAVFTGRSSSSSSSMGGFKFPMNFNTKPISYRRPSMTKLIYNPNEKSSSSSSSPVYVYPSYGSKSIDQTYTYSSHLPPATAVAMDRFSPGEAYGFQQHLKSKKNKGYDYTPPKSRLPDKPASPPAAPSPPPSPPVNRPPAQAAPPTGPMYVPPKDLYAFPPNIDANYLPPGMKLNQRPVTSYLPPPAGASDDFDPNSFIGPVNPKYLPTPDTPSMQPDMSPQDMPPGMMMMDSGIMAMDAGMSDEHDHSHDHNHDHDHDHSHDHDHDDPHDHSHEHDHDDPHDHSHDHPPPSDGPTGDGMAPAMMSDVPAPTTENALPQMMAMLMEALKNNNSPPPSPPSDSAMPMTFTSPDHDHDHFHHHDHDFNGQYGVDVFPEVIYDHDPHDHHHHDVEVATTEAPPEQPRVTKYSYYYLGRKLWYIPLYFTLYFTFYVTALIIKSIGRHKVEWPNHVQKRSIADMSHKETVRRVEKMTKFVMGSIDDFKEKYL